MKIFERLLIYSIAFDIILLMSKFKQKNYANKSAVVLYKPWWYVYASTHLQLKIMTISIVSNIHHISYTPYFTCTNPYGSVLCMPQARRGKKQYMCTIIGGLNVGNFIQKSPITEVYSSPIFHLVWYLTVMFINSNI